MTDAPETPFVRLEAFLKLEGLVETGGQGKRAIQAGEVTVNGTVETRRKARIYEGDLVEIDGEQAVVPAPRSYDMPPM